MNENQVRLVVSGVAIFASGLFYGATAGYFWSKASLQKQIREEVDKKATAEIAEVKSYYQKLLKTGVYSSPVTLYVEKYGEKDVKTVEDLGYDTEQEKETTPEPSMSMYEEPRKTFLVDELEHTESAIEDDEEVDHSKPYVISTDEFMDELEGEWDKITITYFQKDDTLSDERDEILEDVEGLIGSHSLTQFGVKSDDKHTVFVRNEKLRTDFEVVLDEQSFKEVIWGYREREDRPEVRKMREND